METRRLTVEDRPVIVLDDAIVDPTFGEFIDFISNNAAFMPTQTDTQESLMLTGPYWAYKIRKDVFENTPICYELLELINKNILSESWELKEAYVNSNQYGENSYIHKDNSNYKKSITCLIYLNNDWKPDFSGETLFYDSKDDAMIAVSPKFKRVVIFDGEIVHRASPPSRICPSRRLVLVVKFGSNGVE